MKGQVLFRQLRWDERYPGRREGIAYAGVGVVDMPADLLADEMILGLIWKGNGFSLTGWEKPVGRRLATVDLADYITNLDFPAPSKITGLGGGGIILRKTRKASTTPGNEIYLALIVVREIDQVFGHKTIYSFTQREGNYYEVAPDRSVCFETNGMGMAQIHKSPIWGWDEETWGPISTINLTAIDEMNAYLEREDAGLPHPSDMDNELRWLASPTKDPQYDQFKRRMREEGHLLRWDEFQTQSQAKVYEQAAESIVREILQSKAA